MFLYDRTWFRRSTCRHLHLCSLRTRWTQHLHRVSDSSGQNAYPGEQAERCVHSRPGVISRLDTEPSSTARRQGCICKYACRTCCAQITTWCHNKSVVTRKVAGHSHNYPLIRAMAEANGNGSHIFASKTLVFLKVSLHRRVRELRMPNQPTLTALSSHSCVFFCKVANHRREITGTVTAWKAAERYIRQ